MHALETMGVESQSETQLILLFDSGTSGTFCDLTETTHYYVIEKLLLVQLYIQCILYA